MRMGVHTCDAEYRDGAGEQMGAARSLPFPAGAATEDEISRCNRGVVSTPGWDPARDRARGRAGTVVVTGRPRLSSRPAVQAAHARKSRGTGAPPDTPEHDRLVV